MGYLKEGYNIVNKNARVALIIIILVVLVGSLLVFFVFKDKIDYFQKNIPPEVQPIYDHILDCFEQRSIDAIRIVGLQGGYANAPKKSVKVGNFDVAYGLYKNIDNLASLSKIESEISNLVELDLPFCVDRKKFSQVSISQGDSEVNVDIEQSFVEISAKLPLSIEGDNNTIELDRNYEIIIPIRLKEIHSTAKNIVKNHLDDPDYIDLTYLAGLDFDVVFSHHTETNIIYTITDKDNQLNEVPYSFMFIVEGNGN